MSSVCDFLHPIPILLFLTLQSEKLPISSSPDGCSEPQPLPSASLTATDESTGKSQTAKNGMTESGESQLANRQHQALMSTHKEEKEVPPSNERPIRKTRKKAEKKQPDAPEVSRE